MGIYDPEHSLFAVMCRELDSIRKDQIWEVMKEKGWQYTRAKRFVLKREARRSRSNQLAGESGKL